MPDNQSAWSVSQRAREARANRKHLTDLLRREATHGGVWFASHLDTAANLLESECTAEVDAVRAERDRLRAFAIYVVETPEDASGHPSIVADLKLKARELLK